MNSSSGGGGGSGATLYPVFNAQAATEALLDEGEDVLQRFAYQAFGNPARGDVGPDWSTLGVEEWSTLSVEGWSQMAVSPESPLNFGGKVNYYADVETQLYLLGSGSYGGGRYYDPELGRFLSQGPIGFAGGDTLLYRYVGNNPVNALDPSGQEWKRWEELTEAERLRSVALVRSVGYAGATAEDVAAEEGLFGRYEGEWSHYNDGFVTNRGGVVRVGELPSADDPLPGSGDVLAQMRARINELLTSHGAPLEVVAFVERRSGPLARELRQSVGSVDEFLAVHRLLSREFAGEIAEFKEGAAERIPEAADDPRPTMEEHMTAIDARNQRAYEMMADATVEVGKEGALTVVAVVAWPADVGISTYELTQDPENPWKQAAFAASLIPFVPGRGVRAAEKGAGLVRGPLKNPSGRVEDAANAARRQPHHPMRGSNETPHSQISTGRARPMNLTEQLTIREARSGMGREILPPHRVGDPRFAGGEWSKFQHVHRAPDGTNYTVHYMKNVRTGEMVDFKVVNP